MPLGCASASGICWQYTQRGRAIRVHEQTIPCCYGMDVCICSSLCGLLFWLGKIAYMWVSELKSMNYECKLCVQSSGHDRFYDFEYLLTLLPVNCRVRHNHFGMCVINECKNPYLLWCDKSWQFLKKSICNFMYNVTDWFTGVHQSRDPLYKSQSPRVELEACFARCNTHGIESVGRPGRYVCLCLYVSITQAFLISLECRFLQSLPCNRRRGHVWMNISFITIGFVILYYISIELLHLFDARDFHFALSYQTGMIWSVRTWTCCSSTSMWTQVFIRNTTSIWELLPNRWVEYLPYYATTLLIAHF